MVCGAGEELAEERLTLSAMKKPGYAPDLLLENCDGVVHYKPYADWLFYLALNEKTRRVPGIYPRLYLLKKKMEPFFFSSYPMCFVIRARLNQPRIALE